VPLGTGAIGMLGLGDRCTPRGGCPPFPVLDSNMRFYSGFWLGFGVAILWLVPRIERETAL